LRNAHKILIRKSEQERPFRGPKCRWEGNIKIDLKGTGCEYVDWIHLAQDRSQWRTAVNTVMNLLLP